jgi:hypothetical protein
MAQGFMRNKPKAIVIEASAYPAQAFTVPYRVFCQGGGGEIAFARQGRLQGSQSATTVVHIPTRRRTRHCTVQAAILLQRNSGDRGELRLKERT